MFGAYLIWKDRVRLGRIVILIGSGAGFFTLLLFLLVNLRREEFSLLLSVLPAIFGVAIGVVARFLSVPKPLLRWLRGPGPPPGKRRRNLGLVVGLRAGTRTPRGRGTRAGRR